MPAYDNLGSDRTTSASCVKGKTRMSATAASAAPVTASAAVITSTGTAAPATYAAADRNLRDHPPLPGNDMITTPKTTKARSPMDCLTEADDPTSTPAKNNRRARGTPSHSAAHTTRTPATDSSARAYQFGKGVLYAGTPQARTIAVVTRAFGRPIAGAESRYVDHPTTAALARTVARPTSAQGPSTRNSAASIANMPGGYNNQKSRYGTLPSVRSHEL